MHHGAYMTEDWSNSVETSARFLYPRWYWRNSISTCLRNPHFTYVTIVKGVEHTSQNLLPPHTFCLHVHSWHTFRYHAVFDNTALHLMAFIAYQSLTTCMYVHTELPCTVLLGELIVSKYTADTYLLTISSPNINQ